MGLGVGDPQPDPEADEKSGSSSNGSDGEIESDKGECDYLRVEAKKRVGPPTNEDMLKNCATQLAKELRDRPTLPATANNGEVSFADAGSYVRLSLFFVPFQELSVPHGQTQRDDRPSKQLWRGLALGANQGCLSQAPRLGCEAEPAETYPRSTCQRCRQCVGAEEFPPHWASSHATNTEADFAALQR